MAKTEKHGFYSRQGLSLLELEEIRELADICEAYESLAMKLNWNTLRNRSYNQTDDFLCYDHGMLVGFLAFFSFNSLEGEVSGLVHPEYRRKGIFTQLFVQARTECRARAIPTLLLIVEHRSQSGQAFAASLHPDYQHSEYLMRMTEDKPLPAFDKHPLHLSHLSHLHYRLAKPEDAPALNHITAISFNIPEEDVDWYSHGVLADSRRRVYIALLDGIPVGKIDVTLNETDAYILGFGVLPPYRGKGYGRQILAQTIREIRATGQNVITLEVETKNRNALSLYQSCGFQEVTSYDYYSLVP